MSIPASNQIKSFMCETGRMSYSEDADRLCVYKIAGDSATLRIYNAAWANNFYITCRDNGSERHFNTEFKAGVALFSKKDGSSLSVGDVELAMKVLLGKIQVIDKMFAAAVVQTARVHSV